jgi:predicted RNA-binding Zn ribbon-like protein
MEHLEPFRIAGHPALDLLNTVASPAGEPVEYLRNGRDLLAWLTGGGLLTPGQAGMAERRFSRAELDAQNRQVIELREWLRPIVRRSAAAGATRLEAGQAARLNQLLARVTRPAEIRRERAAWTVGPVHEIPSPESLLAPIAAAIADLVCNVDFARVRKCASEACTLWFLDGTRPGTRQWCSMAACGNRAKVAAHRKRARATPPRV